MHIHSIFFHHYLANRRFLMVGAALARQLVITVVRIFALAAIGENGDLFIADSKNKIPLKRQL